MRPHIPSTPSRGFTLIEVLASISVLSLLLLVIGASYTGVSSAWRSGTNLSEQSSGARAGLHFLAKELSTAIVDPQVGLKVTTSGSGSVPVFGRTSSEIFAVVPSEDVRKDSRACIQSWYMVRTLPRDMGSTSLNFDTFCLRRKTIEDATNSSFQIYKKHDWWGSMSGPDLSSVMLVNVRRFYAQVGVINLATGDVVLLDEYDSLRDSYPKSGTPRYSPPIFLDLCLEMLSDQQMQELALAGSSATEVADRLSQKYSTRVHLRNTAPYIRDLLP